MNYLLQHHPVPVYLTLPLFLEIHAVKGHRLDKMVLNATRFMLLIHREDQELPGSANFGWFVTVHRGNHWRRFRPGVPIAPIKNGC